MTINNANVEQINVALLDIDKRIKALNIDNEAIKSLQNSVKTIKSSLNETKAGLQSGATYDINISGNASTATHATTATTAEVVNVAESAAEANYAKTADTATKAAEADHAKLADNIAAGGTSGQVLTSNGPSVAPSWQELATMDNVVKYPDWSNQQKISQTELTLDQDVYIELNQLSSARIEGLKINGKVVSASDAEKGLYSNKFSGYVKKGSVVSYPYLDHESIVRVFPLT